MFRRKNRATADPDRLSMLQKFSLFFFKHGRISLFLWVALLIGGLLSYTVFLQRQGFPSVEVPISVVSGNYFVDDASKVDSDVAKPVSQAIMQLPNVKTVTATSNKNVATFMVEYKEGTTSKGGSQEVEKAVSKLPLPKAATMQYQSIDAGKFNGTYDLIVGVYDENEGDTSKLEARAQAIAAELSTAKGVASAEAIKQYETATNPQTGKPVTRQTTFDRIATRENNQLVFRNAASIGVNAKSGTDALKLYDSVNNSLMYMDTQGSHAVITANFAQDIRDQISSLQRNLAEGLLIVIIVSLLLISWRAGLAAAVSMVTVLFITVGCLKLFGYSLNTITLFALVLCLGLIVDDTTIVAEAIDAGQKAGKSKRQVVAEAVRRVARPSLAGTMVTILTFAPMLFIGGILGSFIRALPITIITSLVVSLVVSLSLIPFLSRRLILGGSQRAKQHSRNPIIRVEHAISSSIAHVIRRSGGKRKRQLGLAALAVALSLGFIVGSGSFFSKLKFDIFPVTKDSNMLNVTINFKPGTTVTQAQQVTDQADNIIAVTLGENARRGEYLSSGSTASATGQIDLIPFEERDVTAPQLKNQLDTAFTNFSGADVLVTAGGVGPPADKAPFKVQIHTEDTAKAQLLAKDLVTYLNNREVKRQNGTTAHIINPEIADQSSITRKDGQRVYEVHAGFDADDTSALVTAGKEVVQSKFDRQQLSTYGLDQNVLHFDFGSESENQDSFNTMVKALPILLLAILVLLIVFFRSLLQPLLIFIAIPFSFLGVAAGLHYTNNPLSFFVMIGFFALIGIAINNTIMLVDYANQAKRSGMGYTEAMAEAIQHRFRPLLTTSLTSVVALTPLALSDPFWQPLAVTLIFGLLCSTFLVIIAFPYYWLIAEWMRLQFRRAWRWVLRRPKVQ